MYWKTFYSVKEIDIELVKAYIFEAVLVDEKFSKRKKENKISGKGSYFLIFISNNSYSFITRNTSATPHACATQPRE